ncbi:MAG: substrate-binding domain-containing protein, partial [Pseudomonadota bacterium]
MNVNNKKLVGVIIGLLLYGCASLATATEISGAGSAAAKAMYTKWAEGYGNGQTIKLNYQPIGPSLGIKQIKGQAADFFTSDVALSDTELRKENLLTFPSAVSGVVPIVNLPGIKAADLQLSGEVLADIFSRKITTWNAPAIVALNPRLSMPNLPISPLVDQENVGLTYNFTDYLSKVSPEWKVAFGKNVDIDWPNGVSPVKGSTALVTALKRTLGTIGYVDFSVVARDKLAYVQLKNHSGKFVSPGLD